METLAVMPKYSGTKDAGVDWIQNIPENWALAKIKNYAGVYNGDSLNDKQKGKYESDELSHYPYISSKDIDVNNAQINYQNGLRIPKEDKYKICPPNSTLMCIEGGSAGKKVAFTNQHVCFVNKLACFVARRDIDSRFLYYYLTSKVFKDQFFKSMTGLIGGVAISSIKNFGLVLPSLVEQTSIAKFLDSKIAQLDEAIDLKEKQIALLKERKQIIIQKAVTQGLDPNVPMKDSGVDWVGQIPEHWSLKKIKHVTSKIGSGVTPSGGGSTYLDNGIPLLRSQNVHFDRIDLRDVARISSKTHIGMANSKVLKGDVLLNITGGSIGRCYYTFSDEEMNVNQHVCILRPTNLIRTIYLNAILASEVGQSQIWFFQQGGGREGLNFQALKNFFIPLPPVGEQKSIVEFVHKISSKVSSAIEIQQKQIEKLKEYKTTLINNAVTGKIKVA